MNYKIKLTGCLLLWLSLTPLAAAEYRTFFGVDALHLDTEISYPGGVELYRFDGLRFRYGIESPEGASAGVEFVPVLSNRAVDNFGDLFELEIGPTLGAYFTVGKPLYLRMGVTIYDTRYTAVDLNVLDESFVSTLNLGIGFNVRVSYRYTIYAEFSRSKSTEVNYSTFFTGSGKVDHEYESISLGLNYLFN